MGGTVVAQLLRTYHMHSNNTNKANSQDLGTLRSVREVSMLICEETLIEHTTPKQDRTATDRGAPLCETGAQTPERRGLKIGPRVPVSLVSEIYGCVWYVRIGITNVLARPPRYFDCRRRDKNGKHEYAVVTAVKQTGPSQSAESSDGRVLLRGSRRKVLDADGCEVVQQSGNPSRRFYARRRHQKDPPSKPK